MCKFFEWEESVVNYIFSDQKLNQDNFESMLND